ncbi:hypothetical protein BKA61DRAFT_727416 [Leptodontidium sp. MPI-SDFR-AT-0119]|nr:hypothetical protein BKA61DRAFT_727416 [Leptodontidium sp. MPI-SDFR-AT-0119]
MVVIAVAGGTGGLGKAIVEALKARGKNEVKIFSRKADPELEAKIGVPIIGVDYGNVAALTKSLEENKVHTVISILKHSKEGGDPDVNLIKAADASNTTKRYMPSEWGVPLTPEQYNELAAMEGKVDTVALLKTTSLETCIVHIGFFMDYFGQPHYPSYIAQFVIAIDIANNLAAIPGTGNVKAVLSHSLTIAAYVAAYVDLPKWKEEESVIGDRVTLNEVLALAEAAKGAKFKVTYDPLSDLKAGKMTLMPGQWSDDESVAMMALFGKWFEEGTFDIKTSRPMNELFPEIKPINVAEVVSAWQGK